MNVIIPEEMLAETVLPHIINCGPLVQASVSGEVVTGDKDEANKNKKLHREILSVGSEKKKLPKIAQLIEPFLWMSAGETSSLLHSSPDHNLHCVLDGRKDFIVIPSKQFENTKIEKTWRNLLDLHETFPNSGEWYSKINVDMVSAYKYKILQDVIWYWTSLRAGDCIFMPANFLHQV